MEWFEGEAPGTPASIRLRKRLVSVSHHQHHYHIIVIPEAFLLPLSHSWLPSQLCVTLGVSRIN